MPSRKATRPDDKRIAANRSRQPVELSRYQKLLNGELTVHDLDDEEISAGRCKDKNGGFAGRPPASFPRQIHDAMRMEFQTRMQQKFESDVDFAREVLRDVASSRHSAAQARVAAAGMLIERGLGKVADKVHTTLEIKPFEEDIEGLLVEIEPTSPGGNVYDITSKEQSA